MTTAAETTEKIRKGGRSYTPQNAFARWAKENGYTTKTLGEALGIDQTTASRLLAGKHEPRLATLAKIIKITKDEFGLAYWMKLVEPSEVE